MTDSTDNVTTLPSKKSVFNKTNALRVGVAALAVAVVAVVVVKMKNGDFADEIGDLTVVETPAA